MKNVAAETDKNTTRIAPKSKEIGLARKHAGDRAGLAHRYQQIGISAVAAAVRYQGVAKNPAYAPTQINWRELAEEAVA